EPLILQDDCELVSFSYEDEYFDDVSDACFKIVRTWTVINWCEVDGSPENTVVESSEAALVHFFNGCGSSLPPLPQQGCVQEPPLLPFLDLNGDGDHTAPSFERVPEERRTFREGLSLQTLDPNAPDLGAQPDGVIVYQQTIKVEDKALPAFPDQCQLPVLCLEANGCGDALLIPVPQIAECYLDNLVIGVTTPWGPGFGPYSGIEPGTYELSYIVMDPCGQSASCSTTLEVVDCQPPEMLCMGELELDFGGAAVPVMELKARQFVLSASDLCSAPVAIAFSTDPADSVRLLTCADQGMHTFEIFAIDTAGNFSSCTNTFILEDSAACAQLQPLGGLIRTETGKPVNLVQVNLLVDSLPVSMDTTGPNGTYQLGLPFGTTDYLVVPSKSINPLNGVTTFDMVLITKHILNVQPLDSPYKIIAADINASGRVTTFDLVLLRRLILFLDANFPS
ncbi:MAG: hypothetical protein D6765_10210, partial [Bacteroidetes bacterium]